MGPSGLLLGPSGILMGPSRLIMGTSGLQLDSYWVLENFCVVLLDS